MARDSKYFYKVQYCQLLQHITLFVHVEASNYTFYLSQLACYATQCNNHNCAAFCVLFQLSPWTLFYFIKRIMTLSDYKKNQTCVNNQGFFFLLCWCRHNDGQWKRSQKKLTLNRNMSFMCDKFKWNGHWNAVFSTQFSQIPLFKVPFCARILLTSSAVVVFSSSFFSLPYCSQFELQKLRIYCDPEQSNRETACEIPGVVSIKFCFALHSFSFVV